jgi:Asp-tRNA(Asn)/Glu-tRNA(Gln) amidotransferase A subunit family amidase
MLLLSAAARPARAQFQPLETTIDDIHTAMKAGKLTAHQLVQDYLDRIKAYDQQGPELNCILNLNPDALAEADKLDVAFKSSGFVGPLHGIPVVVKDQADAAGMPTTLGSVLFKDYRPPRDSFAVAQVRKAGGIILGKTTLGEFGAGDALGSELFGDTRNPYGLDRTVGGSSGGNGACLAANFATVGVGEEGFASIRRPSTWNDLVGMRPTSGLVSRSGMFHGWPDAVQTLGPMARNVRDLAELLDAMVGYDPEDPLTALGAGHIAKTYTAFLQKDGLKGARIGILRKPFGDTPDPLNDDFKKVDAVFQKNVEELRQAGAVVVDPIAIPELKELLAKRSDKMQIDDASQRVWMARNPNSPYKTPEDVAKSPDMPKLSAGKAAEWKKPKEAPAAAQAAFREYLEDRELLLVNLMKVMADNRLDAIVYKSIEYEPPLIQDELTAGYRSPGRIPTLNTYLGFVAAMTVPSGFTSDNLPVGITFLGGPYREGTLLRLAYSYEQATHHRKPPTTTPALAAGSKQP